MFRLKQVAMYSARSKRIMLVLCRLCSWTESQFMIGSHFTAAVSGLIVSHVNFQLFLFCSQPRIVFSTSLVSNCFCITGTPCPMNIWSQGRFIQKDPTKMCNTASSSSNQRMMVEVVFICNIAAILTINQWIMMLMTFSCYDNNTAAYLHHHHRTAVFTRFIFSFL